MAGAAGIVGAVLKNTVALPVTRPRVFMAVAVGGATGYFMLEDGLEFGEAIGEVAGTAIEGVITFGKDVVPGAVGAAASAAPGAAEVVAEVATDAWDAATSGPAAELDYFG